MVRFNPALCSGQRAPCKQTQAFAFRPAVLTAAGGGGSSMDERIAILVSGTETERVGGIIGVCCCSTGAFLTSESVRWAREGVLI